MIINIFHQICHLAVFGIDDLLIAAAFGAGGSLIGGLLGNNKPSTPAAPDYAAANKAGVEADAATLPFRLQINQAAATGGVYTDPKTGQTYDFSGKFDPVRFFQQNPGAYDYYLKEGRDNGAPPRANIEEYAGDWLGGQGKSPDGVKDYYSGTQAYRNQTDINSATQLAQAGADITTASAKQQLKDQLSLLPEFNKLNLQQQTDAINKAVELMPTVGNAQRQQDAATFQQNLDLGKQGTIAMADLQRQLLPGVNDLSLAEQKKAHDATLAANTNSFNANLNQADTAASRAAALQQHELPGLNNLSLRLQSDAYRAGDTTGRSVNGGLYGVRDTLASQLQSELAAGNDLTSAQRNKVQQQIRGAQAARGNILGDGAAFDEAIAESDYAQNQGNNRRSQALALINSKDLNPNFSALSVTNPTQVITPNNNPANFTVQGAINPLMPNFASTGAPNLTATTAAPPNLNPTTIQRSDPLAMLNPNAGPASAAGNLNAWNATQNVALNTPNPWMQGLGLGLRAYSAFAPTGAPAPAGRG